MSSEEHYTSAQESDGIFARFTNFAHTRKGLVLLAEMVVSLVVFICFCASVQGGYSVAPIIELIFSAIFFIIFMNQFDQSLPFIHWPWTDLIRCVIAVIIYIIISIIAVTSGYGARIAGGVFGLIGAAIFAYDAYLIFPSLKKRQQVPADTAPPDYSP
ncbi:proteolipid protein 2-like [Carcharodon carcharias]|uniref:proteolipid protein 2-like n=1 Tax=Carcharodon carcharias TaxID=13397 RepID=UPI001B7E4125|nr:proteolipid protein 2-like [Carcharodon carcharias]